MRPEYTGANRQSVTTRMTTTSANIDALFLRNWRSDDFQGLSEPLEIVGVLLDSAADSCGASVLLT